MKDEATYINANWDFICESSNGNQDIWGINTTDNNGFPFLVWQGFNYDNTPPTITSTHGNTTIDAGNDCTALLPDYTSSLTATDNCTSSGNLTVTQTPSAGTAIAGTTSVTLRVTDQSGNSSEVAFEVSPIDNTSPTITSTHGNTTIEAGNDCTALLPDYTSSLTATDNCTSSGNLTVTQTPSAGTVIAGTTSVTLRVTDQSGNSSEVAFEVSPSDGIPPIIACPKDTTITISSQLDSYTVNGTELDPKSFSDNCGVQAVYNNINGLSTLANQTINSGSNTINWTITDSNGNQSTCSFQVTINKNTSVQTGSDAEPRIFPNPTCGLFRIFFPNPMGALLEIISSSGIVVLTQKIYDTKVDVDLLNHSKGLYILNIYSDDGKIRSFKLIKE